MQPNHSPTQHPTTCQCPYSPVSTFKSPAKMAESPPPYSTRDPLMDQTTHGCPTDLSHHTSLHQHQPTTPSRRNGIDLDREKHDTPISIDPPRSTPPSPIHSPPRSLGSQTLSTAASSAHDTTPTTLQWRLEATVRPPSASSPLHLFSAHDATARHYGYGFNPSEPDEVISCKGPRYISSGRIDGLDPLMHRYDHMFDCYYAHSRAEKVLKAYLKHREEFDCRCALVDFTGQRRNGSRCEFWSKRGFKAIFRRAVVRKLVRMHDEVCPCWCFVKREVVYVGGGRYERVIL